MKSLKILFSVLVLAGSISATTRAELVIDYTDGSQPRGWQLPQPQGEIEMAMLFTNFTNVECTLKTVSAALLDDPDILNDKTGDLLFTIYGVNSDGYPDPIHYQKSVLNEVFVDGFNQGLNIVNLDVSALPLIFPDSGQWIVSVTTDPNSVAKGDILIFASDQGTKPSQRWYEFLLGGFWQRANISHGIDVNMHIYSTISGFMNQPPKFVDTEDTTISEGETLSFLVNAPDPDGDNVTLEMLKTGLPASAEFTFNPNLSTGAFNWPTNFTDSGIYWAIFTATDPAGASDTDTVQITVNNVPQPPVLDSIGNQLVDENRTISFQVTASDLDEDEILIGIITDLPTGYEFVPMLTKPPFQNYEFLWTPTFNDSGTFTATFVASDGQSADSETITITVEDIPCTDFSVASFSLDGPQQISYDRYFQSRLNLELQNLGPLDVDDGAILAFYYSDSAGLDGIGAEYFLGNGFVDLIPMGGPITIDSIGELQILREFEIPSGPGYILVVVTVDEISSFVDCNTQNNVAAIPFELVLNIDPVLDSIGSIPPVDEGQTLAFGISSSDADGDNLVFYYFSEPALPGDPLLVDNGDGSANFEWTPGFGDAGQYSVTFRVYDTYKAGGSFDEETIIISVNNLNRPPELVKLDVFMMAEGDTVLFPVLAFDPDFDSLVFSIFETDLPATAVLTNSGFGGEIFTWPTTIGDAGTYYAIFKVDDLNGGTDYDSVNFLITGVNQSPVLDPTEDVFKQEGDTIGFPVTATDPDGDSLILTIFESNLPPDATLNDFHNGQSVFYWITDFDDAGTYDVIFRAEDTSGAFDHDTVTIYVSNTNRPPVLEPIGDTTIDEGQTLGLLISASDPDGDSLTYGLEYFTGPNDYTFFDSGNGRAYFEWTPSYDDSGQYELLIYLDENQGPTIDINFLITVNNVNRPPVFESIGNYEVNEDEFLGFTVDVSDPDDDFPNIQMSAPTLPTANFNEDSDVPRGDFSLNATSDDIGVHEVIFRADDGNGGVEEDTITITVNDVNFPPEFFVTPDTTIFENDSLELAVSAYDVDGDPIVLSVFDTDISGGGLIDNGDGTGSFNWYTNNFDEGTYHLILTAESFGGLFAHDTVFITVLNVPQAPILFPVGDKEVDEGDSLHFTLTGTDPDDAATRIEMISTNLPIDATFGGPDYGINTFHWQTTFVDAGTYSATFIIYDADSLSDSETIAIVVNNVNRPPVLDPIGSKTFFENVRDEFDVTGTDPDTDQGLEFTTSVLPAGASFGPSSGGHTFAWQPSSSQVGDTTIIFYVNDGLAIDSEVVIITVNNIPCPDFSVEVFSLDGPQQISFDRQIEKRLNLAIQNTGETGITDPVEIDFFVSQDSAIGNCDCNVVKIGDHFENSVALGGPFSIDLSSDSVSLLFDETFGTGPAWLCVQIDGPNEYNDCNLDNNFVCIPVELVFNIPPILDSIRNKEVNEGDTLKFIVSGSDPDFDQVRFGYFVEQNLITQPIFIDSGNGKAYFEWNPGFNEAGEYDFGFYVDDFNKSGDEELTTITVNNVNRAPVIDSLQDALVFNEGEFIAFRVSASDPDDDCLTLGLVPSDLPQEAQFFDNGDCTNYGDFAWTPNFGDAGVYHAIFVADDDSGAVGLDTVVLVINNINAPPQFDPISFYGIVENDTLDIQISATDIDGNLDSIYTEQLPVGASYVYNGNGTGVFNWTPDCSQSGEYSISYFAADDSGLVDTAYLNIFVGEACDLQLTVVTTPCLQCAPPQFYTDILVSDNSFAIVFNKYLVESSISENISIISARGALLNYDYDVKNKSIRIYPQYSQFLPIDTILVTLTNGIYDLDESSLDSNYNLIYTTGPVVYPGDCNNDGTVNEIDVLSIGLFWNKQGPDREVGGDYYLLDFFAQPAHFEEQGNGKWEPFGGVYADVDGSGMVDAIDLCGIAINFAETVNDDIAPKTGGEMNQGAALSQVGSKVLEQMRDALIECPESEPKAKMLEAINNALSSSTVILPTEIELHQNYPNPFNPATTIEFSLPKAEHAVLEIYNMLGQRVVTLVDEKVEAGYRTVLWNGTDYTGKSVASGIYFYRLNTETKEIIKRMLLIK